MDFANLPKGTTFYCVGNPNTRKIVIEDIRKKYNDPDFIATSYKATITYKGCESREDVCLWGNDLAYTFNRGFLFLTEKEAYQFRLKQAEEELITKTNRIKETIEYYKKKVDECK